MKTLVIDNFSGGISDDIRSNNVGTCTMSKHFDITSNPKRLSPFRGFISDSWYSGSSTGAEQFKIQNFLYSSTGKIYGLGQKATPPGTKLFIRQDMLDDPSSANDWDEVASGEGTTALDLNCFIEYKDYFWGTTSNSNRTWKYGPLSSSPTFDNTGTAITNKATGQGIVAKDDNLYIPCGNLIVRVSGTTVTDAVLTLPTNLTITSLENYGNYLAIACKTTLNSALGNSKLFIWDLTSTDVTEAVEFGQGALQVIANIGGNIIGIMDTNLNNAYGLRLGRLVIKRLSGNEAITVKELTSFNTGLLNNWKVVKDNSVYFYANVPQTSTDTSSVGIWSFGRKSEGYGYSLKIDQTIPLATPTGMANIGNIWIVSNSSGEIRRTDNQVTYTVSSTYETNKINGEDITIDKQLLGVALSYSPLPSAGQVVLKYRKNEETSWTTIFTETTDNAVRTEANTLASGANLPQFNEIQFQIISTGGAEVTGLKIIHDDLVSLLNTK